MHSDGTEAGLDFTLGLRFELDLFANVRPIRLFEGVRTPLADISPGGIDFILLRENTEGLYAARGAGSLLRDDVVVHEGTLKTLKRFMDEVAEVQSGQECGMAFENYDDIRKGDVIEIFETEEVERTL